MNIDLLNVIGESTPLSVSLTILAVQIARYLSFAKTAYQWGFKQYRRWKRGKDWELEGPQYGTGFSRGFRSRID